MKKFLLFILSFFLLGIQPVYAEEETYEGPEISAPTAILIDENTGTVLLSKNSKDHYDPAGLSKLMAVYLSGESIKSGKQITMSSETFAMYDHSAGVIWIQEGETLTVEDTEYAAMLANANDTTAMIAQEMGGQEQLLNRMNQQAETWELADTEFMNIYGYAQEGQYTSARDIAFLVRKALKNQRFKQTFEASSYIIKPTNLQVNQRILAAGCEMIRSGADHYDLATGCKVGYTKEGGFVLAVNARRENTSLIAVVLGEESEKACYRDARTLLEYGFDHYRTVTITVEDIGEETVEVYDGRKHTHNVIFSAENDFSALLPVSITEDMLKYEISVLGRDSSNPELIQAELIFTVNGTEVTRAEMNKRIETYQNTIIPEESNLRYYFDLFSIGVCVVFFVFLAGKSLRPPQ